MKAQIIETKAFNGEYYNTVNAIVKYGKKLYAVRVETSHDFNENFEPVIGYISSFSYLTSNVSENRLRDLEIKMALRGLTYSC